MDADADMDASDWLRRVSAVWAAAGDMADLDVVAAIDALVAERQPDEASAVFEYGTDRKDPALVARRPGRRCTSAGRAGPLPARFPIP